MIPLYGGLDGPYEYTNQVRVREGQPQLGTGVADPGDPATQSALLNSLPADPSKRHLLTSQRRQLNSYRQPVSRPLIPRRSQTHHEKGRSQHHQRVFSLPFSLKSTRQGPAGDPSTNVRGNGSGSITPRPSNDNIKEEKKEEEGALGIVGGTATAEHAMDGITPAELAIRLASAEDTVRKLAAFKLKDAIGDPSFADMFAAEGGVTILKNLCMTSAANTLAYGLSCFANLLEIDKGWEDVDQSFVQRVVSLVIKEPLVNILRGAMSILVAIVQRSGSRTLLQELSAPDPEKTRSPDQRYRLFLEMLVSRLSSADHQLCANALQLINSLMRDAITNNDARWPHFIKQVQDLGVIRAVYSLMQSTALQDLAQPLLEFQTLTKILLRKWRDVAVDMTRPEHQKAMKGISSAAIKALEREVPDELRRDKEARIMDKSDVWARLGFGDGSRLENEFDEVGFLGMMDLADYVRKTDDGFEKLVLEQGMQPVDDRFPIARASISITAILYDHFDIEKPDLDDVKDYLALDSRNGVERLFKPMLLQWSRLHTAGMQSFLRIWKATGATVADFDKVTELIRILLDAVIGGASRLKEIHSVEEEIASYDCQTLRELQMELVELAYEDSWGEHLKQVREELHHEALLFIKEQRVRCMLAGSWFPKRTDGNGAGQQQQQHQQQQQQQQQHQNQHPGSSLTEGKVTANGNFGITSTDGNITSEQHGRANWRFARLSHNRRYLHYADFEQRPPTGTADPTLDELVDKIDLQAVSSVISNVVPTSVSPASSTTTLTATAPHNLPSSNPNGGGTGGISSERSTYPSSTVTATQPTSRIVINAHLPVANASPSGGDGPGGRSGSASGGKVGGPVASTQQQHHHHNKTSSDASGASQRQEVPVLTLYPATPSLASEWLDGLLMLLDQAPITDETKRLLSTVGAWGLKIRLLNVSFDDNGDSGGDYDAPLLLTTGGGSLGAPTNGNSGAVADMGPGLSGLPKIPGGRGIVPSREGLDEDYYYDVFGGT